MTSATRLTDPPSVRRREQRAWYFYDWANSAYVTTTLTVLFAPYQHTDFQSSQPESSWTSEEVQAGVRLRH